MHDYWTFGENLGSLRKKAKKKEALLPTAMPPGKTQLSVVSLGASSIFCIASVRSRGALVENTKKKKKKIENRKKVSALRQFRRLFQTIQQSLNNEISEFSKMSGTGNFNVPTVMIPTAEETSQRKTFRLCWIEKHPEFLNIIWRRFVRRLKSEFRGVERRETH